MLGRAGGQIAWHTETAARILRTTPPWVLLVPALGAVVIYLLNILPAVAPYLSKETAEITSPIILAVPLVIAAGLAATRPHVYYKWLALFALALFLRELHFQGTNTGFYIAIVLLIGWASFARDRLEPFISNKVVVTILMSMLWTYAVSKTFDRRIWDSLLPAGITNDLFEENLEIMGHIMFFLLVVASLFVDGAAAPSQRNE